MVDIHDDTSEILHKKRIIPLYLLVKMRFLKGKKVVGSEGLEPPTKRL